MPWGRKQTPEDPEDEAYAAEVERQIQMEKDHEQRRTFTQTQPYVLPNLNLNISLNDKAEVKGHVMDHPLGPS